MVKKRWLATTLAALFFASGTMIYHNAKQSAKAEEGTETSASTELASSDESTATVTETGTESAESEQEESSETTMESSFVPTTATEATSVTSQTTLSETASDELADYKARYKDILELPANYLNVDYKASLLAALTALEQMPDGAEKASILTELKFKEQEVLRQEKQLHDFIYLHREVLQKPLSEVLIGDEAEINKAWVEIGKLQESKQQQSFKEQLEKMKRRLEYLKARERDDKKRETSSTKNSAKDNKQELQSLQKSLNSQSEQIKKLQELLKSSGSNATVRDTKTEQVKVSQAQNSVLPAATVNNERKQIVELYTLPVFKLADKWYPDKIVELPWKTTYNDGEKARLDGLAVQFVRYVPYPQERGLFVKETTTYFYDRNNTLFKGWRLDADLVPVQFENSKSGRIEFFFFLEVEEDSLES